MISLEGGERPTFAEQHFLEDGYGRRRCPSVDLIAVLCVWSEGAVLSVKPRSESAAPNSAIEKTEGRRDRVFHAISVWAVEGNSSAVLE